MLILFGKAGKSEKKFIEFCGIIFYNKKLKKKAKGTPFGVKISLLVIV